MKEAKSVTYVGDGGKELFALVTGVDGDKADLLVWTEDGFVAHDSVPKKALGGDGGYGHTWH